MYRTLQKYILENVDSRNVLILSGPRQVGKTTILKNIFSDKAIYIDLDDKVYRDFFDSLSAAKYRSYIDSHRRIDGKTIIILDEAQRLKDPGLSAKLIYDEIEDVKLILTGSAALDIKKKTAESLAGRKTTFHLYPLSFQEYLIQKGMLDEFVRDSPDDIQLSEWKEALLERMRVGLYPGVINSHAENYLHELIEAVILKDIFYLNLIKNTSGLIDLLRLLASIIAEPINISELSKRLGIARQTISDYIDILEKSYIIFTLKPLNGKREDEISKSYMVYFYDLGIRNALINDFRPVSIRKDFPALWKNFVITEYKKQITYSMQHYNTYYWKTTQGSYIDFVLGKDAQLEGFSISPYSEKQSKGFSFTYPHAKQSSITLHNYWKNLLTAI